MENPAVPKALPARKYRSRDAGLAANRQLSAVTKAFEAACRSEGVILSSAEKAMIQAISAESDCQEYIV